MKRTILTAALVPALALAVAGCMSVDSNPNSGFHAGDPVREVRAEATAAAVRVGEANDNLDIQVREADLELEKQAHAVALEATRVAYQTEMQTQLIVATVEAGAQADTIRARGQAEANRISAYAESDIQTSHTLAQAGAIAIPMVAIGAAMAFVILAWGHSAATVRRAVMSANYVRIGVDPRTLLPPPLVISSDGYLIDTRSGERARLRDAAGVDRMRLAAMTHATETALVARAQVAIAKTTASDQPADALMTSVNTLPVIVEVPAGRGD